MIARLLIALVAIGPARSDVPEVASYAKVSRYGQESRSVQSRPIFWTARGNSSGQSSAEARNVKELVITVSPVYVPRKIPKLKNGEAVDHPSTPMYQKYSTLDQEMIAQVDDSKKQIAARFNPPASFEHIVAHGNVVGQKPTSSEGRPPPGAAEFPGSYDYQPEFLADKPISKPITMDDYSPANPTVKNPGSQGSNSYKATIGSYGEPPDHPVDFSDFPSAPSYPPEGPAKPDFSGDHLDRPPFDYDHFPDDHGYHQVIYESHDHHEERTTVQPEMNDQRLDKRPYSYYFIGKKLWYIPLYFSIYFIIYVAALVLKSVARHKINFPAQLAEAAGHVRTFDREESGWWDLTGRVLEGVESFAEKFGKES